MCTSSSITRGVGCWHMKRFQRMLECVHETSERDGPCVGQVAFMRAPTDGMGTTGWFLCCVTWRHMSWSWLNGSWGCGVRSCDVERSRRIVDVVHGPDRHKHGARTDFESFDRAGKGTGSAVVVSPLTRP